MERKKNIEIVSESKAVDIRLYNAAVSLHDVVGWSWALQSEPQSEGPELQKWWNDICELHLMESKHIEQFWMEFGEKFGWLSPYQLLLCKNVMSNDDILINALFHFPGYFSFSHIS